MHTFFGQIHENHQHLGFHGKVCAQQNWLHVLYVNSIIIRQSVSKVRKCSQTTVGHLVWAYSLMKYFSEVCEKKMEKLVFEPNGIP